MKKSYKIFILSFAFFVILGLLFGCSNEDDTPEVAENTANEYRFTPGTFTGTGQGWGGALSVDVTFSYNYIEGIEIIEINETPNVVRPVVEKMPPLIIEHQTLELDAISGATMSSFALLGAVRDAVLQADGDLNYLSTPVPSTAVNAPITIETDVLVVGSGIAGLASAIEAASVGADVVLIEKMAFFGGNTSLSGSIIQGAGTHIQQAQGIEDTADDFEALLLEMGRGNADADMIHHIAHSSADTILWLDELGVNFSDEVNKNHYREDFPRAHVTVEGLGYGITEPLVNHAKSIGIELMAQTTAVSLIVEDEVVIGVNATDHTGGEVTIYANAVILATGGFDRNPELMALYQPLIINPIPLGVPGVTGDGLLMAREIGASSVMVDYAIASAAFNTPMNGIMIAPSGVRFTDESNHEFTHRADLSSAGYTHFINIFDAAYYNETIAELVEGGRVQQADTLEELAAMIGIDADVLLATVSRYNEMAQTGVDTDFDKPSEHFSPLLEGPFFAQFYMHHVVAGTQGGLRIDLYGRVLNTAGAPIQGLFAAGEVADGQFLPAEYGRSGTAIAMYGAMARLAGITAAEFSME